jgi:deoxycytidylate deaminase
MNHAIEYAEQLIQQLKDITIRAKEQQTCKRKAVGCSIVRLDPDGLVREVVFTHNGPSRDGHECTGEVGNCGCSHAEPRIVIQALKGQLGRYVHSSQSSKAVLVCTYSPCTNCANVIIDSGIIHAVVYEHLTQHDVRGEQFLVDSLTVITKMQLELLVNTVSLTNYAAQESRRKLACALAELTQC